jgi:hypothetical protein
MHLSCQKRYEGLQPSKFISPQICAMLEIEKQPLRDTTVSGSPSSVQDKQNAKARSLGSQAFTHETDAREDVSN